MEVLLDREDLLVVRDGAVGPPSSDLLDRGIEDVIAGEAGPLTVLQVGEVADSFKLLGRGDDDAGADRVLEPGVEPTFHECLAARWIPGDVAQVAGRDLLGRLRHRERVRRVEVREDREGVWLGLGVRGRGIARTAAAAPSEPSRSGPLRIRSGRCCAILRRRTRPRCSMRRYWGSGVWTSNRSRTGASSVSCAWIEMNGSRPAPSSPAVEKSTSGPERNPGSRPGTSTAAAITANATGLEPRTEEPRRRVLEPDHTGPHWRTRRRPSANTTASAAASSTIA